MRNCKLDYQPLFGKCARPLAKLCDFRESQLKFADGDRESITGIYRKTSVTYVS